MLDNNDIALLKGMFEAQDTRFHHIITENNRVLKREIRDEVHSLIAASETRVITHIADLLHESAFPQITQLQAKLA